MPEHYPDHLSPADYREHARARAARSPSGIGAAVEQVDDDRDGVPGRVWVCLVTDGSEFHHLDVTVPDLPDFEGVSTTAVEDAVERAAAPLPGPNRLAALLAGGLLELERDDLRGG